MVVLFATEISGLRSSDPIIFFCQFRCVECTFLWLEVHFYCSSKFVWYQIPITMVVALPCIGASTPPSSLACHPHSSWDLHVWWQNPDEFLGFAGEVPKFLDFLQGKPWMFTWILSYSAKTCVYFNYINLNRLKNECCDVAGCLGLAMIPLEVPFVVHMFGVSSCSRFPHGKPNRLVVKSYLLL